MLDADDLALMHTLLTEEEETRLVQTLAQLRGARGVSLEDRDRLVEWARYVRFWNAALDLTLRGEGYLAVNDDGEGVLIRREGQQ